MDNKLRDAVHDAVSRALDEGGVKNAVLRGMCLEVGLEKFRDAIAAQPATSSLSEDCFRTWGLPDGYLAAFKSGGARPAASGATPECARWNFDANEAALLVCRNDHDKGDDCDMQPMRPVEVLALVNSLRSSVLEFVYRAAHPPVAPEPVAPLTDAWRPIATAPDGLLVVVAWLDNEDEAHPERQDFDYKEDGCWTKYADHVEFAEMVAPAGSRMPPQSAPYTHWMPLPPLESELRATQPKGGDT